jgi:iron complex transport system ATP-binding protein
VSRTIVELRSVTVAYRGRLALDAVDLTIRRGERLAIVGPNGAGKSTLLRAMTGVAQPTGSGRVAIDDEPLAAVGRERLARRIAVVPQQAVLPFAMRVEEVVALGRLPYEDQLRGARPADRAAVAEAIELVGLAGLVGRDVRELSLGERQLVLVGLAVAQSADVVILDEPTVHLDLRHQVEVMELLLALNQGRGLTIVAVLHDLALAAAFFPRIVMLDAGRVVADGAPEAVLTRDRIRQVFGIDPSHVRLPDAAISPAGVGQAGPA